jgi:2,4-dienoyl-CoA reductase (NADPH2)
VLGDPWTLGPLEARNRAVFGPHVTNLAHGRSISDRHVAYYARRARGGAGTIITETASVHPSDWPYERAPLAENCGPGWTKVARAAQDEGSIVIASLGHSGMQGSTAYSQGVLWAPSLVANVATHEMPIEMGEGEIAALREGTMRAAAVALEAGCDGVEVNAGQHSLLRQFMSGLTNHRTDRWADPLALIEAVLADLRSGFRDAVLGVRICGDELAPWAGITPDMAGPIAAALSIHVDYVTIERGSIYSEAATRPDMQVEPGFNRELVAIVRHAVDGPTSVVAQGSIVDVSMAEDLLLAHCDAVEMTRALIADPDLANKAAADDEMSIRPCVLCNQGCQVRDVRNPIVSCSVNPTAGHEGDEADVDEERMASDLVGEEVAIVGAGPAGLEAARRAAMRGARVVLHERRHRIGGTLLDAAQLPGRSRWMQLVAWYEAELVRLGVNLELRTQVPLDTKGIDLAAVGRSIGSTALRDGYDGSIPFVPAATILRDQLGESHVVLIDPVGGVLGVGVAELLALRGARVTLVTPDMVAGTQLSLSGDLVGANERLARLKVRVMRHSVVVAIERGHARIEDRFDGEQSEVECNLVADAAYDLPAGAHLSSPTAGDALAPRGVYAAVLEGRRFAAALSSRGTW